MKLLQRKKVQAALTKDLSYGPSPFPNTNGDNREVKKSTEARPNKAFQMIFLGLRLMTFLLMPTRT